MKISMDTDLSQVTHLWYGSIIEQALSNQTRSQSSSII